MKRNDKIEVLVFVDPGLGISCKQALAVLRTVMEFNGEILPLYRLTLTSTRSTTTAWSDLMPFIDAPAMHMHRKGLRIFGNLVGLTKSMAQDLKQRDILVFGEWHGPDLSKTGYDSMLKQGFAEDETRAMRDGILVALENGVLQGIEFQVTRENILHAKKFLEFCHSLNVEGHLEIKETPFQANGIWPAYNPLPVEDTRQLLKHPLLKALGENPVPPFFCPGSANPRGSCPYFYRGLFLWPDGNGGLYQTVCLSDQTIVGRTPFVPSAENIAQAMEILAPLRNVDQGQMEGACQRCEQWNNCLGGCRAMARLASRGDQFAPDPNCWRK